ncbi:PREDICTED: uncharacterized protein LOC100634411 isoform X2 [Amphimedon queenslandica]|uniref:Uncharacterized protein n=1 Tax=Amphimedon queenslandica TaxID=400682 RepID=A0AAN0JM78_AMPQE|nr:PREDICTED: uncharacterized protein LOC100634411 isoform X2 [Amphimedon queenslandica]|eukprot:XP_019858105.1 PREDICTED: uncharacterized protein LOC100634411 isoform X2 [Amphimedon queenslandica]
MGKELQEPPCTSCCSDNTPPIAHDSSDPPAYSTLFPGIKDVKNQVGRAHQQVKNQAGRARQQVKNQVGRARQQNEGRSENVAVPSTLFNITCKSADCLLMNSKSKRESMFFFSCIYLLLTFNISMIVVGSVYTNDCSLNDLLPIFLIVFGCFSVVEICCAISIVTCYHENEDESIAKKLYWKTSFCFQRLIVIFLFNWFIVNNIFVFNSWGYWDNSDSCGEYKCCNPVLMYFSLVTIIIIYGIGAACCCCLCCWPLMTRCRKMSQ